MARSLRVLVVGVGGMGASHAKAYAELPQYDIAGFVVARNLDRARQLAQKLGISPPVYTDYYQAMRELQPDVVSINTYPDTHAEFSIHAMRRAATFSWRSQSPARSLRRKTSSAPPKRPRRKW